MASFLLRRSITAVRQTRVMSRHLCAAPAVTKTSTGLVGLDVDPDYKNTLTNLYEDILETAKGIPEGAPYRGFLEATVSRNLKVVKESPDAETIEKTIGLGQVEQLAQQARRQLDYLPRYIGLFSFSWTLPEFLYFCLWIAETVFKVVSLVVIIVGLRVAMAEERAWETVDERNARLGL